MRKVCPVVFCLWSMSAAALAQPSVLPAPNEPASTIIPKPQDVQAKPARIHWADFISEWWLFIAIEHTERIIREPKTRNQLGGPFVRDWFNTVSDFHFDQWSDGGKFFTADIAHPAQGAVVEAIFWQNNDHVRFADQDFHSAAYRHALLQAFAFATIDAVQWKLGPLSESSIGNVGLPVHSWEKNCKLIHSPCLKDTGLTDMVMNEIGGTAMTIGFQWLDKHVQKRIEESTRSRVVIDTTRMLTNPPQVIANIVRFRRPWFRDRRP